MVFLFSIPHSYAQIPKTISYQGVLTEASGTAVPDGNYNLTFKLYDVAAGGAALWTETQSVVVNKGMFSVILGSANLLTLPFDKPYWLGMTVGSGSEMTPRIPLSSAPYSFRTNTVPDSSITTSKIAQGAVTNSKIASGQVVKSINSLKDDVTITAGSNVSVTSSGNAVTIAASGGGITLPYSGTTASPGPGFSVTNSSGDIAVRALATNNANVINYGLYAEAYGAQGRGVAGAVSSGHGVHGEAISSGVGVYGKSVGGDGVVGWTGAANKSGVFGHTAADSGIGVSGIADASGAVGVYAYNSVTRTSARLGTETHGLEVSGLSRFVLPSGGEISISTPGSNPGLITFSKNGHRRDIVFDDLRIRLLTSSSSGIASKGLDIDEQGNAYVTSMVTCASLKLTGGSDIAEPFDVKMSDAVKAGIVMVIDPDDPGKLEISEKAYDRRVAGVISGAGGIEPGMVMSQSGSVADGKYPIAVTGRVYCWADAKYGSIKPGDLMTTSDTPGHAMKVADFTKAQGAIIGKAMSSLSEGQGLVLVLVTLQ